MCSFGQKSRDNPLNVSSRYNILVKFLDSWLPHALKQLTPASPKSDNFPRAAAPKAGKNGHSNFLLLPAEILTFEYWSCLWVLINFKKILNLKIVFCILTWNLQIWNKKRHLYFWNAIRSNVLKRSCVKMLLRPQGSTLCIAVFAR